MDMRLTDQVAIVTGGSRGIGKAIARALAHEGVDVVIVGRDGVALEATAKEIATETGRAILPSIADTGDDAAVKAMVANAHQRFGRIDVLVNCAAQPAGQAKPPGLADVTADALWAEVNVKVMGYIRTAREVAPSMIAAGRGRIVNVSGLAARSTGSIIGSIRNISVAALTKNLADELGRHGVSAVCVHPGLTRTEKTPAVVRRRAAAEQISEAEVERRMAGGNALGKLITAEEIADVVTFLASPRSMAINGDVIAAGGGIRGAIHY